MEKEPLFAQERQKEILALLEAEQKVLVPQLCRQFSVSPLLGLRPPRLVSRSRPFSFVSATIPPRVSIWASSKMPFSRSRPPSSTRIPPFSVLTGQ